MEVEKTDKTFRNKPVYRVPFTNQRRLCIKRNCDYCDEEYWARKDKLQQSGQRGLFCSVKCSDQGKTTGDQEGEKNPNWKGGVSQNNYRYTKKQRKKHPEKIKARQKARRAVKNGKIKKKPCEICGSEDDVHAHHEDYDKPLDVNWLCRDHHQEYHESDKSYEEFRAERIPTSDLSIQSRVSLGN